MGRLFLPAPGSKERLFPPAIALPFALIPPFAKASGTAGRLREAKTLYFSSPGDENMEGLLGFAICLFCRLRRFLGAH